MYARRACKMMTQNITNFTRKEPVRIRARKEDTKLNAPSSRSQSSQSYSQAQVYTSPCTDGTCDHGGRWGQNGLASPFFGLKMELYIESKIEFELTFRVNVLCVFGTTY